MTRVNSLLAVLALAHFSLTLQAQSNITPPHGSLLNFEVPSPNAAALGKFGNVPVGYATGIPDISIPIYSYENRPDGLELNLSLSYHAGGIHIEEKASNIGIGWALSAGGVITRDMRGGPDDGGGGYTIGYWASNAALPDVSSYNPLGPDQYVVNAANPYYRYYKGMEDAEPDVFTFNFAGKQGKFIIGKNQEVFLIPQQNLKITRNWTASSLTFTITADDGVQYVFDQKEDVFLKSGYACTMSWYLSKIIAPFGQGSINFTYESYNYVYPYKLPQVYYQLLPGSNGNKDNANSIGDIQNRSGIGQRLLNISFPDSTDVNFIYDSIDRCDVPGDKALKRIEVVNGTSMKGFRLDNNYSFSLDAGSSPCATGTPNYSAYTRLVLHKVTGYSGSMELPPYMIEYNTSVAVPGNFSYAQDHWGFYNGANGNQSLIPWVLNTTVPNGAVNNANRNADPSYAQGNVIKKISYPTGGYTLFSFESNEIPVVPEDPYYEIQTRSFAMNGMTPSVKQLPFTVTDAVRDGGGYIPFNFEFGGFGSINNNCTLYATITSADGSTTYAAAYLGSGTGYKKTVLANIPNGNYLFKYSWGSNCYQDIFLITMNYQERVLVQPSPQAHHYVGGLRIKRVEDYAAATGNAANIREFEYLVADSAVSSGVLAIKPYYSYSYRENCHGSGLCEGGCRLLDGAYLVTSSSSQYTLASSLGSPVLYSRSVEKFIGAAGEMNGKIVRTFTTSNTQPDNGIPYDALNPGSTIYPYITPQQLDWMYGLPVSEIEYDAAGNIKHRKENAYSFKTTVLDTAIRNGFKGIRAYIYQQGYNCGSIESMQFSLNQYYPVTGRTELVQAREVDFGPTADSLVKVTNYQYDPSYYYLSKVNTRDSKGNNIEKRLYYPHNYTATTGVLAEMRAANILEPIVAAENWLPGDGATASGKIASAQITEYAKFNNALIKPFRLYYLNSADPVPYSIIGAFNPAQLIRNNNYFLPEVEFSNYDTGGRLLSQKKLNDALQSYIWSTTSPFPLGEVKNGGQSEIAYSSFEGNDNGNWTVSAGTANSNALAGKRSLNLTGTISKAGLTGTTAYIVSYWSLNGALSVNGVAGTIGRTYNGWTYYQHILPAATTSVNISGTRTIDELRLYPIGAIMKTNVYAPLLGITSVCDAAGNMNYYEYDVFGRLKAVRDQDSRILKQYDYQYQQPVTQ